MSTHANINIPSVPLPNFSGVGPPIITTPKVSVPTPSNPLSAVSAFSGLAAGFGNTIGNKGFWIRFGTVGAGVGLVWVGVLMMLAANRTVRDAAIRGVKAAAEA